MAERQFRTLTKRTVDRLSVNGKDAVFWDNDLPGFGVRVYPSGRKVFVVQTRAFGDQAFADRGVDFVAQRPRRGNYPGRFALQLVRQVQPLARGLGPDIAILHLPDVVAEPGERALHVAGEAARIAAFNTASRWRRMSSIIAVCIPAALSCANGFAAAFRFASPAAAPCCA